MAHERRSRSPNPVLELLMAVPLKPNGEGWCFWGSLCSDHSFFDPECELCVRGTWMRPSADLLLKMEQYVDPGTALTCGRDEALEAAVETVLGEEVAGASPAQIRAAAIRIARLCERRELRSLGTDTFEI